MSIYNDDSVRKELKIIANIVRYLFIMLILFAGFDRIINVNIVKKEPYQTYYALSFVTVMFFYITISILFWVKPKWFKKKVE